MWYAFFFLQLSLWSSFLGISKRLAYIIIATPCYVRCAWFAPQMDTSSPVNGSISVAIVGLSISIVVASIFPCILPGALWIRRIFRNFRKSHSSTGNNDNSWGVSSYPMLCPISLVILLFAFALVALALHLPDRLQRRPSQLFQTAILALLPRAQICYEVLLFGITPQICH